MTALNNEDALRAELASCRLALRAANDHAEHFERMWYLRGDDLEDLREKHAEALLDAERWRWWRANFGSIVVETEWRGGPAEGRYVRSVTLNPLFGPTDAASIDAAIDCAIAKQGDKIRPVR